MIKPNEGPVDRGIRIAVGMAALMAGIFFLNGAAQIAAFVMAAAGIVTGAIGFCGLYTILGINTCPKKG